MFMLLWNEVGSLGKAEGANVPDVLFLSGKFRRDPPIEPPPEPEKKQPPIHPPARDPQPKPINDPPVSPPPGKDPDDELTPIGDPPDKSDQPIRMDHTPIAHGSESSRWETLVMPSCEPTSPDFLHHRTG